MNYPKIALPTITPPASLDELSDKLKESLEPRENPAKWTYKRLSKLMKKFQDDLDDEHEIGLKIIPLGNLSYYVNDLGYWGPDMLIFYCLTEKGIEATLIQHYSQLNFLLVAMPKLAPQEPPRRIGFSVSDNDD